MQTFSRTFSTYSTKVAVIGAGAGGHSLSSQLVKAGLSAKDVTVFDPAHEHHY
jgi:2-polyprenyl-6-methoxyphenol hydroxylase-like FAD-dependent oxidoreductase